MSARVSPAWLGTLRSYLLFVMPLHLAWELLQLPLYTLWSGGSRGEIAFAVLHCTAGDALIASFSLLASLLLTATDEWPDRGFRKVALVTILFGFGYTVYSEWHNVYAVQSWAYTSAMPRLFGIGLSPLAQWLILPGFAFWWLQRQLPSAAGSAQR